MINVSKGKKSTKTVEKIKVEKIQLDKNEITFKWSKIHEKFKRFDEEKSGGGEDIADSITSGLTPATGWNRVAAFIDQSKIVNDFQNWPSILIPGQQTFADYLKW